MALTSASAIGSVLNVAMNALLMGFSAAAMNVLGVYFKLQSFIFMPVFGLNQGLMPILGFNFGARDRHRTMHALKLGIASAAAIMGVGLIIFQTMPKTLLGLFDPSAEMIDIGTRVLRTISLCFLPAAVGIMTGTLFQATNHGFLSLIVSLLRQLILILPLAFILAKIGGLELVLYAFPLAEIFALIMSLFFTKWIYTHQIKPLDDEVKEPII